MSTDGTVICGECGSVNIVPANLREAMAAERSARDRLTIAVGLLKEKSLGERCVLWKPGLTNESTVCVENPCWFCRYQACLAAPAPTSDLEYLVNPFTRVSGGQPPCATCGLLPCINGAGNKGTHGDYAGPDGVCAFCFRPMDQPACVCP